MKRTLFKWLFVALLVMAGFTLSWAGSGDPVLEGKQITGKLDVGSGTLEIPNSTNLPASCVVGEIYMDTDATSGQRCYLCESENVWVLQGDGGAGLWTDAGTYYHPNNWSYMRILDSDRLDIANSTAFANGFPWDDTVPYPGSVAGSMVNIGQESSTDGNPPLWVQKIFNKSSASATHYAGAGHFEVWKQSGSTNSFVSTLTGQMKNDCSSGQAIGVHGRVYKGGAGNSYAMWASAARPAGQTEGHLHGIEINTINKGNNETFGDTVVAPADIGVWIYPQGSTYPGLCAIGIGADSTDNSHFNGILFNTHAVRNVVGNGVGINMYSITPEFGIKFSHGAVAHIYYADATDGLRIKSLGHTININSGGSGWWYWRTDAVDEMRLSPVGNLWVRGTATASCGALTCDYVFEPDYDLMTLDDLQVFVETEKELPGMTINRGGSYSTATLREELVEELEEQSLYILQLHERLKALETNYVH